MRHGHTAAAVLLSVLALGIARAQDFHSLRKQSGSSVNLGSFGWEQPVEWGAQDDNNPLGIEHVTLNNGVQLPLVGLGTWQYDEETAFNASLLALQSGYRHIDTAAIYGNQKGVGNAIRAWRASSGAPREDLFVTTKIAGGLNESAATEALEDTLKQLDLDYVDLMLVHMPSAWDLSGGPEARVEGWHAMEKFYKAGKARAIGVSHYCKRQLEDILSSGTVKPAINQVEFHIGMGTASPDATDYREFTTSQGIQYQSFSPLCGPCNTKELIDGVLVSSIGKKYGKSGAQVSLRWQVQQGIPVIPKTKEQKHMLENADLFSWELSSEDMATLTSATSPPVTGGGDQSTSGDCKIA